MKNVKIMLVMALFSLTFVVPSMISSRVYADHSGGVLKCYYQYDPTSDGCDLALTKEVGVNGSTPVEAETTSTELTAKVGDTVTYVITVSNDSSNNLIPEGYVTVTDNIPSGVTLTNAVASTGTYSNGSWTFDVNGNLPATLTLTTTANEVGVIENIATLTGYACSSKSTVEAYSDANSSNNSDQAYVNVTAVPVVAPPVVTPPAPVVKAPSAPNTGFGVSYKNPWTVFAAFLIPATAILSLAFATKRHLSKKQG